jgi:hypothetical protein
MFRYVNESQAIHLYLPHVDLNGLATVSTDDGSVKVFRVPRAMLHDHETSMSTTFGPRFAWLGFLLGFAALCSVACGHETAGSSGLDGRPAPGGDRADPAGADPAGHYGGGPGGRLPAQHSADPGGLLGLPDSLPTLFIPNVPFSLETLQIIFPFALAMAFGGLLESLMTAKLVDDVTDTPLPQDPRGLGPGRREHRHPLLRRHGRLRHDRSDMINVKASGARTRISTFLAGIFLLIIVVVLGDIVSLIPMAALVAVTIFVSVATFDWHSIRPRTLKMMPKSETIVTLATVIVTVATHNLAVGVGVGILLPW